MAKWGLGYDEVLSKKFPQLIYCSISGFGATGPLANLPGYDAVLQAMCGLMSVNGDQQSGPTRIGVPVVDQVTGYNAFSGINFGMSYSNAANTTISYLTINTLICPSEVRPEPTKYGVVTYGVNVGDWYVWGGANSTPNRATFGVNQARRLAGISDGLSNTLMMAEVKAYQPYYRNTGAISGMTATNIPSPNASPESVTTYYVSATAPNLSGHAEWVDGHAHQTGVTTAWTPNRKILGTAARNLDVDLTTMREANGGPTFASITSRSYHPGGVQMLKADGSVSFVSDNIRGEVWRALGTVAGGEILSLDSY